MFFLQTSNDYCHSSETESYHLIVLISLVVICDDVINSSKAMVLNSLNCREEEWSIDME